jgi:hypothetical protein
MRYLVMIHLNEEQLGAMPKEEMDALIAAHLAYDETLQRSGHFVIAQALQNADASTIVRVRGGKVATTDGPFIETKEQLSGFYLIDAKDLNDAIQVAGKIPSAPLGSIEIRPIWDLSQPKGELPPGA